MQKKEDKVGNETVYKEGGQRKKIQRYVQKCTHWRKWQKWQLIAKIAKL